MKTMLITALIFSTCLFASGYTAANSANTIDIPSALQFQLVGFKDQRGKPLKDVQPYDVFPLNETSGKFTCKPRRGKTISAALMSKELPSALISGTFRECELVQLDFGTNGKYWVKHRNLVSNQPEKWQRFVERGSKKPFCFSKSSSSEGKRASNSNTSRGFC